jgi:hypothetical protein
MTVVMATSLLSIAFVFDSYVLDREVPLPQAQIHDKVSELTDGEIWNSIVTQLEQLS